MKVTTYQCEECEVPKQKSNHWVIGLNRAGGIQFYPWVEAEAREDGALHICGPGCAAKVLSKAIEGWSKQ